MDPQDNLGKTVVKISTKKNDNNMGDMVAHTESQKGLIATVPATNGLSWAFKNDTLSDIKVVSKHGGEEIPAHRIVLVGLPFFRDRLLAKTVKEPKMTVSRTGNRDDPAEEIKTEITARVLTVDISPEALLDVLRFAYQVPVSCSGSNLSKLMSNIKEVASLAAGLAKQLWKEVEDSSQELSNNAKFLVEYIETAAQLYMNTNAYKDPTRRVELSLNRVRDSVPWYCAQALNVAGILYLVEHVEPEIASLWFFTWASTHPHLSADEFKIILGKTRDKHNYVSMPNSQTLATILSHGSSEVLVRYILCRTLNVDIPAVAKPPALDNDLLITLDDKRQVKKEAEVLVTKVVKNEEHVAMNKEDHIESPPTLLSIRKNLDALSLTPLKTNSSTILTPEPGETEKKEAPKEQVAEEKEMVEDETKVEEGEDVPEGDEAVEEEEKVDENEEVPKENEEVLDIQPTIDQVDQVDEGITALDTTQEDEVVQENGIDQEEEVEEIPKETKKKDKVTRGRSPPPKEHSSPKKDKKKEKSPPSKKDAKKDKKEKVRSPSPIAIVKKDAKKDKKKVVTTNRIILMISLTYGTNLVYISNIF